MKEGGVTLREVHLFFFDNDKSTALGSKDSLGKGPDQFHCLEVTQKWMMCIDEAGESQGVCVCGN